ncbi:TetR/AcrR family transcriptional regulator [Allokutzneria sp. NRRL B-24872]|uniref:TetR/AcrR family transcriptional regulator n=1 Tax=Allokutzneria sp. NRRL B-24872 TaxID=1137961 RepID=UPI000A36B1DB|nr:TetR/AcrR family transcriptional regulator [Allokutzneria sp. NRRL B-24872]
MSPDETGGLRERKKLATREALSAAALRLAMERGPENVRVDDIAEAAGVSPRTYNNYFSSREQAIVAALAAERALRVGAALRARPADEPLAEAVVAAVLDPYTSAEEPSGDALTLITSNPALRKAFVQTLTEIEQPLAAAIEARTGSAFAATVLASAVSAAARVALESWVSPAPGNPLLVVPQGSLVDRMREALAVIAPALAAAG